MRSRFLLGWLLAGVVALSAAPPSAGQGPLVIPEGEILVSVAEWLGSAIATWPVGKMLDQAFDRVTGKSAERQLEAVKVRLEAQIKQGGAGQAQLQTELAVAHSELRVLRGLMNGVPSAAQLAHDRKEINGDLATIRKTLAEHEKRLAEHDRQLADHGKLLEEQGRRLDDLERRVDVYGKEAPPAPRDPQPEDAPQAPLPPAAPFSQAGPRLPHPSSCLPMSLRITVGGPSNFIRLFEATRPVSTGRFRVHGRGMRVAYYIPRGSCAVVELFAAGNLILIPARLAAQVQIQDHGWKYQSLIY